MTFHQSSAALLTVAAVVVAGFHLSRRPSTRRSAPAAHLARGHSWKPAASLLAVVVLVLAALFTAAFSAGN